MKTVNRFLQSISWKNGQKMQFVFNSCNRQNDRFFRLAFRTIFNLLEQWRTFLASKKNIAIGNGNVTTFGTIVSEAIKNANDHGNECHPDKIITAIIWTGDNGFLAAVKDEGYFFTNETNKINFEKKIPLKETWKPRSILNHNLGLQVIYSSDELFVDTETGFLYMLWLFK